MIDIHCHLNFHSFEKDYEQVIKRAHNAGVTRIINVGTKIDSSEWAVKLAHEFDNLYAIVGVHPHHADKIELSNTWLEELRKIALEKKVIGIGEIGLDYFSYKSNGIVDPALQKEIFSLQIELAHELNLPLQIHNRHAGEDVIKMLKERKNLLQNIPGMFHCFAGTMDVLKDALDLGFYIGFDGNSTYKGLAPGESVSLSEQIAYTPLDRIVTETDSPYLTPLPHRGQRNEPAYVILVGQHIALVKNKPFEQVVEQTTKNVYTVFSRLQ
ncbi:MAG: Hydrolase, TatD family [Patescibacteria group bacterium]|nr:Hydrolase, TatD family [Patescibacteria group bacterium]